MVRSQTHRRTYCGEDGRYDEAAAPVRAPACSVRSLFVTPQSESLDEEAEGGLLFYVRALRRRRSMREAPAFSPRSDLYFCYFFIFTSAIARILLLLFDRLLLGRI